MGKIKLTDEEIQEIINSVENETELNPDITKKLSPSFFDKLREDSDFDFEKLDKYKIPTIEYAGKRSETAILNQATLMGGNAPLEIDRCFDGKKQQKKDQIDLFEEASDSSNEVNWKNLIVQGDNLQFLKTCYLNQNPLIKDRVKGKVKLIYIDPPFATKSDFGGSSGESSYSDKVDRAEFLEALRERLLFMREILADDGSIYVHLDYRTAHYAKIILDEIFSKNNFVNEIIWSYRSGGASKKTSLPKKHETILLYRKGPSFTIMSKQERQYLEKPFMGSKIDEEGRYYVDTLIRDILEGEILSPYNKGFVHYNTRPVLNLSSERLAYPTQKPEGLLQFLIDIASSPKDLVMDCFAGSGTTAAVAEKLGRRWIACDFGKHAIYTMQKRMLEIDESKALGEDASGEYGKPAKPFCVVSVGAYDFSKIMNLRENKEIYIQFVTSLFHLTEVNLNLTQKYHLANIYAEKEGDPVEVYPVWEDEYLKDIKIDKDYLQGIIDQSGGKLSGEYYIIAPETCTRVNDIEMENSTGGKVYFKILSFPYKVLEEFARKQKLQEQPSDQGDINNLIDSVGFYFNEEVEAELGFVEEELKIKHFSTEALNAKGNRFEDLDGLAMVLIDKDYDGEVFTMEEAVYLKDIEEDGTIKVKDLSDKVGVIVIDKHGNETKLITLER